MYEENPNKEKRIAFLSIFSSLCRTGQIDTETASKVVDSLFEKYPLEGAKTYQPKTMSNLPAGKGKICPVPDCGHPMIRQFNKKNPKAPDWKCSDKNCKFSKAYDGGWKKSEFITGAWDEPDANKARQADNDFEASQQENDEYPNFNERN
jgi:hypothetical protein